MADVLLLFSPTTLFLVMFIAFLNIDLVEYVIPRFAFA